MLLPKVTNAILNQHGRQTILGDKAIPRVVLNALIDSLQNAPVYLLGCDAFVERGPNLLPLRDGWSIELQEMETIDAFRRRALIECNDFASQLRFDDDSIWFVPVIVELLPSQLSSKLLF